MKFVIFCLDLNRRGYRNIVDRQSTIWQGDSYMFSKFCRVNHVNLGTRSVKKSLRKRVRVKNKDYLKAEDNFDDVLTNEEEVEAISHIGNLRRKPSVVRYGSRGARTSHRSKNLAITIWQPWSHISNIIGLTILGPYRRAPLHHQQVLLWRCRGWGFEKEGWQR